MRKSSQRDTDRTIPFSSGRKCAGGVVEVLVATFWTPLPLAVWESQACTLTTREPPQRTSCRSENKACWSTKGGSRAETDAISDARLRLLRSETRVSSVVMAMAGSLARQGVWVGLDTGVEATAGLGPPLLSSLALVWAKGISPRIKRECQDPSLHEIDAYETKSWDFLALHCFRQPGPSC